MPWDEIFSFCTLPEPETATPVVLCVCHLTCRALDQSTLLRVVRYQGELYQFKIGKVFDDLLIRVDSVRIEHDLGLPDGNYKQKRATGRQHTLELRDCFQIAVRVE